MVNSLLAYISELKGNISIKLCVIFCCCVILFSCNKDLGIIPQIKFDNSSGYVYKSDSIAKSATVKMSIKCTWNGKNLLKKLHIYANGNTTIEKIDLEPPIEAFGYDLAVKKSANDVDSLFFELADNQDNINKQTILLYLKKKKK